MAHPRFYGQANKFQQSRVERAMFFQDLNCKVKERPTTTQARLISKLERLMRAPDIYIPPSQFKFLNDILKKGRKLKLTKKQMDTAFYILYTEYPQL